MNRIPSTILCLLLAFNLCLGQTAFMQLTPGTSTRSDAVRVLGQPVKKLSETLFEYQPQHSQQKVFIQYGLESAVIQRLESRFDEPIDRSVLTNLLGIAQKPDTTKWDSKGRLEEYFGSTRLIILTHETSEATSPIISVGYYSRELFAIALERPTGRPLPAGTPQPSLPLQSSTDAPPAAKVLTAPARTTREVFDEVGLLVPKGDKADEKSVRLIFDRGSLMIEADKGNTVFKSFPYESIKSAEYSYSKHPRWKAGLGAAVVLGVFALPIFFMKSKKHWLTIKTADDFAILHLDKGNYKMILPTFETSTGKRVETVADEK